MTISFSDLGVRPGLVARLCERGINDAFPIQIATIPDALAGLDVCGRAPTGSGKTLAFGLAVVTRCTGSKPYRPRSLILVPTRELAHQIEREIALLSGEGQRVISVYGGTSYGPTRKALSRGVDTVVACPGRLEDLLEQGALSLSDVQTVVVDEADRMADMGFLPAVRRLMDLTPVGRQVLLYSATLGPEIESVVRQYMTTPSRYEVELDSEALDVEHFFWRAGREDRVHLTARLVGEHGRALVFCRTKHGADRLARQLKGAGVVATAIHGDRSQAQRERALAAFSRGAASALVATDVAARGIHVEDLPCVVHFDLPADSTDYLHRSGRTGRAGKTGTVVALVTDEQQRLAQTIQRSLGLAPSIPAPPVMMGSTPRRAPDQRPESPRPESLRPQRPGSRPTQRPEPRLSKRSEPELRSARTSHRLTQRAAQRPEPRPGQRLTQRPAQRFDNRKHNQARSGLNTRNKGAAMPVGTVKFFNAEKGYGFVSRPDGEDVFVHYSNVEGSGYRTLEAGQQVEFEVAPGRKGDEARNVKVI